MANGQEPETAALSPPGPPAAAGAPAGTVSLQVGPLAGLVVACLAGGAAWGIVQMTWPVFALPEELAVLPAFPPPDKVLELDQAMAVAARNNAAYALAVLGLCLGTALGAAEALARGQRWGALLKSLAAGLGGGAAGALAGLAGSAAYEQWFPLAGWSPLAQTIVLQMGVLGVLGLGLGLGLGLPYARPRLVIHGTLGAVLGGFLAALLYPVVLGCLLPGTHTELVVPRDAASRAVWLALTTGLIGLVATGLGKPRPSRPMPVAGTPEAHRDANESAAGR